MKCSIYRCAAKADMYLYVPESDGLDNIPQELLPKLGDLTLSIELELDPDTRLARGNTGEVLKDIKSQGFHLQLPLNLSVEEIMKNMASEPLTGKDTLH